MFIFGRTTIPLEVSPNNVKRLFLRPNRSTLDFEALKGQGYREHTHQHVLLAAGGASSFSSSVVRGGPRRHLTFILGSLGAVSSALLNHTNHSWRYSVHTNNRVGLF